MVYYKRPIQLKTAENLIRFLLKKYKFTRFRIDPGGLGMQMAQTLKYDFPGIIEIIPFSSKIKVYGEITKSIKIKEYMAMNYLKLLNYGKLKLLNDDMHIKHLNSINNNYDFEHNSDGHGDTAVASFIALLPYNYKSTTYQPGISVNTGNSVYKEEQVDEEW